MININDTLFLQFIMAHRPRNWYLVLEAGSIKHTVNYEVWGMFK